MRKRRYAIQRTQDIEEIVKITKEFLNEKTDSKALEWLIARGFERSFK